MDEEKRNICPLLEKLDLEQIIIDNTIYRQALINFSAMVRVRKEPALLIQGSEECEGLVKLLYNDIKARWDEDADKLLIENRAYERSNELMEEELNRLRAKCEELYSQNDALEKRLSLAENKSFLSRIFNR